MSTTAATSAARVNLAPEVYQASQRAKRRRQLATTISTTVCIVAIGAVAAGAVIIGGQRVYINTLKSDISNRQTKVQSYTDLPEAATAEQHLVTLGQLYGQRVYFSRFFDTLEDLAPQGIAISSASIDQSNQLKVSGTAKSYDLVTKFAKALEASNTQVGANASPTQKPYFSDLALASVSSSSGGVDFVFTAQMSTEVTNGH